MNTPQQIDFDDLAESKEFRQFFEIVRELTGIRVVLMDPTGRHMKWLHTREQETPLCRLIYSCAAGEAACHHTDRVHCQAALRQRKAIHYICHAGLIDIVAPIYVDGVLIATINGGQVLPSPPTEKGFSACRKRLKDLPLAYRDLRKAYFLSPHCSLEKATKAIELLAFFAEYFSEVGWRLKMTRHKESLLVTRAKQFIHDHFREPIGLTDIARSVSRSPTYFSAAFHHETGQTVVAYLQAIRIHAAQELLRAVSQTVTEIAFKVGFNNSTHFNRVFRKIAGCTPQAYRCSNQTLTPTRKSVTAPPPVTT